MMSLFFSKPVGESLHYVASYLLQNVIYFVSNAHFQLFLFLDTLRETLNTLDFGSIDDTNCKLCRLTDFPRLKLLA